MAEKCFCDKLERNFCKILTIPASQGQKGGYQKNGFWASPDPSITSNILFWAKYRRPLRKYREPLAFKTTLFSNNLYRVIGQSAVLGCGQVQLLAPWAVHLGNVWACKDTVIVILVLAPFPWSWVGDWGLKAWQLGLRHDIRIYLKSAGWHWDKLLYKKITWRLS